MKLIQTSHSFTFRTATAITVALGLSGCSFGTQIADHAVDYNRAVETAENSMFFLNVIRAAKGYPLHFTRISEFTGALEASGSATAKPPIGSDADDIFGLDLNISGKSKPTFGVAVLDDQKFMNGLQTSITQDTFKLYRDQGWPMPVLLYALAEKVEISTTPPEVSGEPTPEPKHLCTITNSPTNATDLARFDALVQLLSIPQVQFSSTSKETPFGPVLKAENIRDIAAFAELHKAGFKAGAVPWERYEKEFSAGVWFQLTRTSSTGAFQVPTDQEIYSYAVGEHRKSIDKACEPGFLDVLRAKLAASDPGSAGLGKISAEVTLRSTQGLIYFLGELVRAQRLNEGTPVSTKAIHEEKLPELFVVREGAVENPAISVEHEGTIYAIPSYPHGGRSLQFIALARQLFALNLTADTAPKTQTIRFIN